jgi:hypothetical protein
MVNKEVFYCLFGVKDYVTIENMKIECKGEICKCGRIFGESFFASVSEVVTLDYLL